MTDFTHTLPPAAARTYGVTAIIGPLLLMASTAAFILLGEGINVGVLGGIIGVWSSFALLVAMVAVLRLVEPRAPRAASVLTLLAVIGFGSGVGFNVNAVTDAIAGPDSVGTLNAIADGPDAIAMLAWIPGGWFAPLSMLLIGIALWRTRTVAWWSAALLSAAGVLFVVGRMERIGVLALAADSVLIAALAPLGWAMITGSRTVAAAQGRRS